MKEDTYDDRISSHDALPFSDEKLEKLVEKAKKGQAFKPMYRQEVEEECLIMTKNSKNKC
jgi:ASC-1-like (ASCH) protein